MKIKTIFNTCFFVLIATSFSVNHDSGKWQVLQTKNKATERSECGMAACNGKLYLVGGEGSSSVEALDLSTLTWSKKASAPVVMHHFQAVSYQNKIYVPEAFSIGGFPDQIPMSNIYIYDTEKDQWEKGAELVLERRRGGAGAAAYHGKIYLVAGIQHGHSSGTTNMFDVYDPKTNQWEKLPDAPHIRDHCSAAVINDKLYVAGGRNTSYHEPDNFMAFFSKTVLDVDCYDFKSGQWTSLSARLPLGSGGGALVNLNGILYYMGGERATKAESNAPRKNTYFLDPSTANNWAETESLEYARNGMAAAVLNNKIYVFGGAGGGPRGPRPGSSPNDTLHRPPPGLANAGSGQATVELFSIN